MKNTIIFFSGMFIGWVALALILDWSIATGHNGKYQFLAQPQSVATSTVTTTTRMIFNSIGQESNYANYLAGEITVMQQRLDALDGGTATLFECSFNYGDHVETGTVAVIGKETLRELGYGTAKCKEKTAYSPHWIPTP
jgi:hypothetical protein